MKRFESPEGVKDTLSIEHHEPEIDESIEEFSGSPEDMKDYLFDAYMKQQLLEDFIDEMRDYLDEADVDQVREILSHCSDEQLYAALSLPKELRERKFEEFEKQVEAGVAIEEVVNNFVQVSEKYGFSIGYHTSPVDIRPDEEGRWLIKGTEADHRDDDLMMAYYSSQYRHLFKKRHPKFIYIVRTDPSTHRTDGNWSRASSLSVVARVPFEDVHEFVEATAKRVSAAPGSGTAD